MPEPQTIHLPNGHTWSFSRQGQPGGTPVLLHHGLIGDARIHPEWVALAEEHKVELIAIERPGYGNTPPQAMQAIGDWPGLISPLLEFLGLPPRIHVLGISAGAPYALALAAAMPDRIATTLLLGGVPFVDHSGVLSLYAPDAQAAYASFAQADEMALRTQFAGWCHAMATHLDANGRMTAALAAIETHGFAGPAREARLQARPWGFTPAAVTGPVHAWHAREDEQVPFIAVEYSLGMLPAGHLHIQADPSHVPSLQTGREVFALIASQAKENRRA